MHCCLRLHVDDLAELLAIRIRCRLGRLRFIGGLSMSMMHFLVTIAVTAIASLGGLGSLSRLRGTGCLDILYRGGLSYGLGNTAYCRN